ncbi:hypothetical protein C0Z18_13400 [Trinickia dabaoshanensis]|uniref:HemN C-terminal domain-containing protein n=2 Tax=Trinickia dabaoshanensis TaxID=564714 RepID=A0A2N7VRM7_9BURK|nr:hypothetical protein C0Z18_13400 [Trinickia dabaoshanensis]
MSAGARSVEDMRSSVTTIRPRVMHAMHFSYPGPEWFVQALGASYVESWIRASRQPHWFRPSTLAVFAPLPRRKGEGDASGNDDVRANLLRQEMSLFARKHGTRAGLAQVYWSVGVTALPESALARVHASMIDSYDVQENAEFIAHVAMDSRPPEQLSTLRALGVTTLRASIAATRTANTASIERFFDEAREAGFRCVAVDLPIAVPTVPMRTVREWAAVLSTYRPSRIFLARPGSDHLARRLGVRWEDTGLVRRAWQEAYATFIGAGYEYVAHDVFARRSDAFAEAKRLATLVPGPYGYCTRVSHTSIAIGPGAIGNVGPMQYQNYRDQKTYAAMLQAERLPIERGFLATADDLVRRAIMAALLTNFSVDIEAIEQCYGIDFPVAFRRELAALDALRREGAVEIGETQLQVTSIGRVACDRIADVFDRYIRRVEQARPERDGL